LELIKDYDLGINYHPGKANVVTNALSHRSHVSQLVGDSMPFELCEELDKLNLMIVVSTEVREMEIGSSLHQEIQKGQLEDEKIQEIKCNIKEEKSPGFIEEEGGVLWYKGMICVPNIKELKIRYFVKHITLLIPFILEGIRCTMISRPLIGGME
jgi:hypothetical protein